MYLRKGCSRQERGAITVFLAIVFTSLIIFAGVIIDIVRIAAAERKVQSILNSSARSVLAGYDSELTGSYGIYGINVTADGIKDDFYRYVSVNIKERHEGISFIDIKVDREDVEIQGLDGLLKDDIFKKQIQEYMKYRTPIKIAETLIEQFKNIRLDKKVDFANGEKVTRDKARELRIKTNEVNAKLEGIKKKITDLSAEKLEEIKDELSEVLTISNLIYGANGEGLLDEYIQSREETNNKARQGECIENRSEEFGGVKENCESLAPELQKCLAEVDKTLFIVKPLQKELKLLNEELDDLKDDLEKLRKKLSKIEKDDDSFSEEADSIRDEMDDIGDEMDRVEGKIEQLESRIENEVYELKKRYERFSLKGYTLKGEAVQLADKKAEELKKSINKIKESIEKSLLRRIEKNWLVTAEELADSNFTVSEDFGLMDEEVQYYSSMHEEDAEKSNDIILKNLEKLEKSVKGAAIYGIEKINTIEYVMDKFTFLTSKTERDHYFKKGEVEYIISGADTKETYTTLNNTEYYVITNVLLQVWALRFAIDAIDSFISSAIIFPPQRLAFALAEGALDSCLDVFNMLNGEGVAICPKSFTSVKLKYSDHLKLLLLMKPEEEILRKAKQLMQINIKQLVDAKTGQERSDFRLGDYSTVISAAVKAKVNLFFLPLLKVDKLMPGSFEEGRYIIRKQIYMGY